MKDKKCSMSNFLSIAAIIVSLVSIYFVFSRPIGVDLATLLVAILSLLVTILLGWQIYSVIDVNKKIKEIQCKSDKKHEETMARTYTSIMNQTSYVIEGRNNDDCYNAISNGLFAYKHYFLAGNNDACRCLLNIFINSNKKNYSLSRNNLYDLWKIVGQLKENNIETSKIEDWLKQIEELVLKGKDTVQA